MIFRISHTLQQIAVSDACGGKEYIVRINQVVQRLYFVKIIAQVQTAPPLVFVTGK